MKFRVDKIVDFWLLSGRILDDPRFRSKDVDVQISRIARPEGILDRLAYVTELERHLVGHEIVIVPVGSLELQKDLVDCGMPMSAYVWCNFEPIDGYLDEYLRRELG